MIETVLTIILSGAASGIATIIVLKNDMAWIKQVLHEHNERLTYIERKKNGLASK